MNVAVVPFIKDQVQKSCNTASKIYRVHTVPIASYGRTPPPYHAVLWRHSAKRHCFQRKTWSAYGSVIWNHRDSVCRHSGFLHGLVVCGMEGCTHTSVTLHTFLLYIRLASHCISQDLSEMHMGKPLPLTDATGFNQSYFFSFYCSLSMQQCSLLHYSIQQINLTPTYIVQAVTKTTLFCPPSGNRDIWIRFPYTPGAQSVNEHCSVKKALGQFHAYRQKKRKREKITQHAFSCKMIDTVTVKPDGPIIVKVVCEQGSIFLQTQIPYPCCIKKNKKNLSLMYLSSVCKMRQEPGPELAPLDVAKLHPKTQQPRDQESEI